jgi:tryptophan 2,3-dioxygenase
MSRPKPPPALPPLRPDHDLAGNHYWRYHDLEALLACKRPVTTSADEDLFISVHQICELGFHQMILDLDRTLDAFARALDAAPDGVIGDTGDACYFLRRAVGMYQVVDGALPLLMTMRAFSEFRAALGPSSGFQSFQFRRLEIMTGVTRAYWTGGTKDAQGNVHPAETEFDRRFGAQVAGWFERYRARNLRVLFETLRDRAAGETPEARARVLAHHAHATALCRWLHAFDEAQLRFHRVHLRLAVQQLEKVGVEIGTGGTSFRDYLARYEAEQAPLFPGLEGSRARHEARGASHG